MTHISLPAETIFHFFSFPISNSLLVTWLLMAFLIFFSFRMTRQLKEIPSNLQNFVEFIFDRLETLFKGVAGEKVRIFFPLVTSFFLFIILSNWSGLLPGFGSIGIWEVKGDQRVLVPFFRRPTADLNTTLALAIFSVGMVQYFGLRHLRLAYLKKFLNFQGPIDFFVGILEIFSEIAKILSFSFRLFGNMFAGEVLVVVMVFLVPLFAPLPFLALEIFIGFVQALIFSMLTLVFLNVAVSSRQH